MPWAQFKALLETAVHSPEILTNDTRDWIVTAECLISPAIVDVKEDDWQNSWGHFGNNLGDWMDARNSIAHMRVPAGADYHMEVAWNAIHVYLPRFLGMLVALSGDNPKRPLTDDDARQAGQAVVKDEKRCPWHGRENDLQKWLRLPAT